MPSPDILTLPGSICPHVHFREPGSNIAETFESGSLAALFGGYIMANDMPNTPGRPTWTLDRVEQKAQIIEQDSHIPMGIIIGSQPESDNVGQLAKMAPRSVGLKLYGAPTTGNLRDYEAREFGDIVAEFDRAAHDKPIMFHAGQENLEDMIGLVAVDRDHPLHICHVNDPNEVRLVQRYKKDGRNVTCGVTPHHLFKNSHAEQTERWFARMLPRLARQADAEELFWQLVDGEIDIIETDHAPHTYTSKWEAEEQNPGVIHDAEHTTCFGVPNIEFAMPLLLYQVKCGNLALERLKEVTTYKPAEIIGVTAGPDTGVEWEMSEYRIEDETRLRSGAGWTPFLGMLAVGEVKSVRIGGRQVVQKGKVLQKAGRVVSTRGEVI